MGMITVVTSYSAVSIKWVNICKKNLEQYQEHIYFSRMINYKSYCSMLPYWTEIIFFTYPTLFLENENLEKVQDSIPNSYHRAHNRCVNYWSNRELQVRVNGERNKVILIWENTTVSLARQSHDAPVIKIAKLPQMGKIK